MRWSLRYQILLPMIAVMLITLVGVSLLNAYLSAQKAKSQIHSQLRDVAETISRSSFPLTDSVLQQIRGLSGAEFVVTSQSGQVITSSNQMIIPPVDSPISQSGKELVLGEVVHLNGKSYFHAVVDLSHQPNFDRSSILHVFYPEENYNTALWNAIISPLLVGGVALILVVLLSLVVSSRVTRPLGKLKNHVEQIAHGDFQPMPLPDRNDEILDLGQSVNQMAEMLASYEEEVRRHERLRTLGQLSGSMAHQLRNAATGCRMALDLHRRDCNSEKSNETLDVALRQLAVMERYLKQFFSRSDSRVKEHKPVDLVQLVKNVLKLVRPNADHVGVRTEFIPPEQTVIVKGDSEGLEQLIINLLQNGIEASAIPRKTGNSFDQVGKIVIRIEPSTSDHVILVVQDSGLGPAHEVKEKMFEPLVTGRADGTGLGLSVAQEIAIQHQSIIRWERRDEMTHFIVELPLSNEKLPNEEKKGV